MLSRIGLLTFLSVLALEPSLAQAAPETASPPTVAVLYFDYEGQDAELGVLRKGMAQMLITDLAGHPSFRVVERTRLQDVMNELELNQTRKIDRETANRLGRLLGARYLVLGGYFVVMGKLTVNARVTEVETGDIVKGATFTSTPDDFLGVEQKLSASLEAILSTKLQAPTGGPKKPGPADKGARRAPRPPAPKKLALKTALSYSRGLDALDRKDHETARAEMKKALAAQPDFSLARVDLKALVR